MEITVGDAARLLNCTPRAIRYLIERKQLPARRVGRSFLIHYEDLALTEAQRQEAEKTWGKVRTLVDQALPPALPAPPPMPVSPAPGASVSSPPRTPSERVYTVRHLRTFTAGGDLYPRVVRILSVLERQGLPRGLDPASPLLAGLDALASAFFQCEVRRRREGYLEARRALGQALGQLWIVRRWLELAPAEPPAPTLDGGAAAAATPDATPLKEALVELDQIITSLEGEVLGGLKGLLMRLEGKKEKPWEGPHEAL